MNITLVPHLSGIITRHGMCTLTIYSTLYLSSLIKENIDRLIIVFVVVYSDLKYLK